MYGHLNSLSMEMEFFNCLWRSTSALRAMTNSIYVSNFLLNLWWRCEILFNVNQYFFSIDAQRRAWTSLYLIIIFRLVRNCKKYIRPCFRNNISSDTLVVKIFASFCHVYICIRLLGYFRIENMTNWNLNNNQNCKKKCRCNFVTWKLIFLVSWIVMLWCQCSKYLNLFRNRVSLHDVIIFTMCYSFCFSTLNLWFKFEWSVLTSSFHSSKLQSSFCSSRLHPSWIHELSVGHICADSKVSDLISDFEFSRSEKSAFDDLPLYVSFVSLIPCDFPLDIFLFSFTPLFIFTLGPWLALSVLVRRSLVCTITALQSRWK